MVEIKGFDKAYNRMLAQETIKRIHKEHISKRVKELTTQGIDKEVAKAMAQVGL